MGELKDKAAGYANEVAGKVKSAIGNATDDADLKAKGAVQQAKGEVQKASGAVKGAMGDKI